LVIVCDSIEYKIMDCKKKAVGQSLDILGTIPVITASNLNRKPKVADEDDKPPPIS